MFSAASAAGWAGQSLRVISPQMRSKASLLLLDGVGNSLTALHFLLLGRLGGCYAALFRTFMNVMSFMKDVKPSWFEHVYSALYAIVVGQLVLTLWQGQAWLELVPQCSSFFSLVARPQSSIQRLRLWMGGTFPFRWSYAYIVGSWPVLISDIACAVNVVWAYVRHEREAAAVAVVDKSDATEAMKAKQMRSPRRKRQRAWSAMVRGKGKED